PFWLGALTALIFFMQQDQVLPLLPFLVYVLFSRPRWLQMLAGSLSVTALILLYFGLNHALTDFWKDAFMFNLDWYTHSLPSAAERYRAIKSGLHNTDTEMPLIIALALGVAAFKDSTDKRLLIAALLSTILAFSPQYLSGRSGPAFVYYYLPLSAAIPILVFLSGKKFNALFGFLLCALPLYNALQHASHLSGKNRDIVESIPEFKYLEQQQLHEDYQLYILGDNNWVYAYNKFHILAPTHWIYHQFWEWYDNWDSSHQELEGMVQDLLRHRTKYIIYFGNFDWRDQSAKEKWENFLHEHYVQKSPLLWQLRQ
ncbi:MAG TPA: hypothetical protein VI233_14335, partial [Puia sp.]